MKNVARRVYRPGCVAVLSLLLLVLLPNRGRAWQLQTAPLMTDWAQEVGPNNAWPEYPRPQMQRTNWMNLNGVWQFQPGGLGDPVPTNTLSGDILVPFCMESAISGVMQHYERAWYQRTFTLPASWAGQRILLHFEAANWECEPFLNGVSLGVHQGGYDPFTFDITPFLSGSAPQTLTVRIYAPVDNTGGQTLEPLGKQRLSPGGIWYAACSGIWQTVWLEPVPASGISDLHLVPDIDNGRLRVNVTLAGPTNGITVSAQAFDGTNLAGIATGASSADFFVPIPSPKLWCPTNPFLYDLQVTLSNGVGALDTVRSYFGMRKISLGTNNGFVKMMLNNQFVFQLGPLDQGYWPDGIYTPPTDAAMRGDIELTKALGFNLIRKHMKVEPARYYYWADRLGMLIWQDMPSMLAGANIAAASRPIFENELSRMLQTHWNAPSIIVWTVFNEGWAQYDTVRISGNVMNLDPSRLVNCASGWTYYDVGHIQDSHSYPNPSCPQNATKPVVNGEFGGVGLGITNHTWAAGWGYVGATNGLDLTAQFEGFCGQLLSFKENQGLSAAVYTQTTDVETELNGLYSYDRKVRKPVLVRVQAAINSLVAPEQAQIPIQLVNNSFEQPVLAPPSSPPFTNLAQIPGWTFPSPATPANSGIVPLDWGRTSDGGSQALWLRSQDGPVFQTTSHTVASNEVYTLTLDAQNAGQSTSLQMQLFYEDNGNRTVLGETNVLNVFDTNLTGGILLTFSLTIPATAEAVGHPLGLQFRNLTGGNDHWEDFDNVRLTYASPAPVVIRQPVGGNRYVGTSATFAPVIAGQAPLEFQWQRDGANVPGGTNLVLQLSNLQLGDAGDYVLYATNAFGTTNTAAATLTVQAPTLVHRYSFTSDARDSVGGAAWRGTLYGNAVISGGQLALDGTAGTYVQLPAGILSNYDAVTIEAWASFGANGDWCRLFDFGDQNASGQGRNYILLTPHSGGSDTRLSIADADPGFNHEQIAAAPGVLDGQTNVHLAAVFYPAANLEALYLNGSLAALNSGVTIPLSAVVDNLNYLGRSLYAADAWLNGSIDELRIYQGALSAGQIALDCGAGPNQLITNAGSLLAVRFVVATNMAPLQTQQALLLGDFSNISNVNLFSYGPVSVASSAPAVASISAGGLISARNPGTATITAVFNGVSYLATVRVAARPFSLKHRYSFTTDASDSIGGAAWSGTLHGNARLSGGQVVLDGSAGTFVSFPAGIISGLDPLTIECWASFGVNGSWAELCSFGDQTATGTGQTYVALIPHSGAGDTRITIRNPFAPYNAEQFGAAPGTLDGQTNVHVVAIWNPATGYEALYLNGALAVLNPSVTIPLATVNNALSYLGKSLWNPDPLLVGSVDEFRIYQGVLSAAEIAADFANGPATLAFPSLQIALVGGNLRISWPAWATRYSLYSSPALGPGAAWTLVPTPPLNDGSTYTATVPVPGQMTYFRLSN